MSWLALVRLVLMILEVLVLTVRIAIFKKVQIKLVSDVVLELFYLLCGLVLFFQSWQFNLSQIRTFVITVLALTNIFWVANDVRRN